MSRAISQDWGIRARPEVVAAGGKACQPPGPRRLKLARISISTAFIEFTPLAAYGLCLPTDWLGPGTSRC